MSLVLHRGAPFGPAEAAAHEAWERLGGVLVVRDADAANRALTRAAGHGALLDREVVTLAGLRGRVRRASGLGEAQLPGPMASRLALQEALDGREWPGFGAAAEAPGFLGALERAVGELRAARIRPADIEGGPLAPPQRDLAELYRRVEGRLRLAVDSDWETADAAGELSGFPPVALAGFDDLSPDAWALLRHLGHVGDVTLALAYEPGRAAYRARDDRQARWSEAADRVVDHRGRTAGRPPALEALEGSLFEDSHPGPQPAGPVRWVEAAGSRGMLRAAVEEILGAVESGTPLARCALVVPRLAEARDDLDRLLADWGVPARRASRTRFLETPLGLALTDLIALGELEPEEPGALDPLLGWLRSPYAGADPGEVDGFERDMRRGAAERRSQLIGRWEGAAIAPAIALVAAARAGPRAQVAALLRAGWAGLERAAAVDPSRADRRDAGALLALGGLAAELAEDAPDGEDRRPRGPLPRGALGRLLADLTFRDEEGPSDGLSVLDYAGLRGRRFALVVLCGLDADGLPGRPAPDPLLGPLRARLADRLPPRASGTDESRLRFLQGVAAAGERLVLVRRFVDDDGREIAPSPYWMETLRLLGRRPGQADRRTGARGELAESVAGAPSVREALRALAASGRSAPGPLAAALGRRRRERGLPSRPFAARAVFSVTSLEAYLQCPYGWLHDRVLRPEALERPFDAAAEGSFGHGVLEQLFARMRDEGAGACTHAALALYLDALPAVMAEVDERLRPPAAGRVYAAFLVRTERHIRDLLRAEADAGPHLVPSVFEQQIDDEALVPGARIMGFADRIDLSTDGALALAIDYKRSGARFPADDEEVAVRLQLPLYAEAAARAVGAESAGGLYVAIAKRAVDGRVRDDVLVADGLNRKLLISPERWRCLVEEACEAAATAIAGIRAGELAPPANLCSTWCAHPVLWR